MGDGGLPTLERSRDGFRIRGANASRLEALTDGVFALAVTLLVVTSEVPKTFPELVNALAGFPAFAACFAILIWFWFAHNVYCRRYGLADAGTTALTACLLFVVLYFVYVMKFMYAWLLSDVLKIGPSGVMGEVPLDSARQLMAMFSAGYLSVCVVFAALYARAWASREKLGLDGVERLTTRYEIVNWGALALIPILSLGLTRSTHPFVVGAAGWCYGLIGVVKFTTGMWHGNRVRRLQRAA